MPISPLESARRRLALAEKIAEMCGEEAVRGVSGFSVSVSTTVFQTLAAGREVSIDDSGGRGRVKEVAIDGVSVTTFEWTSGRAKTVTMPGEPLSFEPAEAAH